MIFEIIFWMVFVIFTQIFVAVIPKNKRDHKTGFKEFESHWFFFKLHDTEENIFALFSSLILWSQILQVVMK